MTIYLTGKDWAKLTKTEILDDDGWRNKDGVTLNTPITFTDYYHRMLESTVSFETPTVNMNHDDLFRYAIAELLLNGIQ